VNDADRSVGRRPFRRAACMQATQEEKRRSASMMKAIEELHYGIVGVEAHGRVTAQDYETVFIPAVERALRKHRKLRLLYHLAPDFTGFTSGALWDDARVGIRHLRAWERIAVVTDARWIAGTLKALRMLVPATTRLFRNDELQAAKDWLRDLAS
jgi:hypothetical protein